MQKKIKLIYKKDLFFKNMSILPLIKSSKSNIK